MALDIRRIERVERTYTVTATDADGEAVTVDSVDVAAVTPPRASLTGDHEWTTYAVTDGEFTVEYCGPDAEDQTGDVLLIPLDGAQTYFREVDGRLVDAEKLERVNIV